MAAAATRLCLRGAAATLLLSGSGVSLAAAEVASYAIAGDAVPEPLGARVGDKELGRQIVLDRTVGNCLICHAVPEPAERFMGNIGPDLTGIGSRLSAGQLRFRLIDASRLNSDTLMPPYYRTYGLTMVATQYRGTPVLTAQQLEDVVAYLASLKSAR